MKFAIFVLSVVLLVTVTYAQQTTGKDAVNFTATSANVAEAGTAVRINILRWSPDADRNALITALNPPPPLPPPQRGAAPEGERGAAPQGDRGAGGGRGGAGAAAGRGGGGGRGGGRGDAAAAAPADPTAGLTAAIGKLQTLGYIWTNEVIGYSLKYAIRSPLPTGGERIILATDRRLGANSPGWKPKAPALTDYQFTVVEIRLDAKGTGQAKTSLTSKVVVDKELNSIALEDYAAAPAILQNIKKQ